MKPHPPPYRHHRICGQDDRLRMHQCGQLENHTGEHACPCGEIWWES